jgi:ubiquinone/menaquinone biosynthesis C-methylase UbiE
MGDRNSRHDVCSANLAWFLDLEIRRWFQDPNRILQPFIKPGQTVVDLGCGPGFFTLAMAQLVGDEGKVIAVDLQEAMLQKMTAKLTKFGLENRVVAHQCAEDSLGVKQPCDFALAFYMVHEVPDSTVLLKQINGMLTMGGKLLIVEPKFHVSRFDFLVTVRRAQAQGFELEDQPKVAFSRAALLRKVAGTSVDGD